MNQELKAFLQGTLDPQSSLRTLRGQADILRYIWIFSCEEWWNYHIGWYQPKLYRYRGRNMDIGGYPLAGEQIHSATVIPDLSEVHTKSLEREWEIPEGADKVFSGCPVAVISKDVKFPPISHIEMGSYTRQVDNRLNINMMPFDLADPIKTLPHWCHGYLPLIKRCADMVIELSTSEYKLKFPSQTAYLTIDERLVEAGESHRRGGLHVESSIWSNSLNDPDHQPRIGDRELVPSSMYWGGGPIRASRIHGGIFVCSNVPDSTAIWNCQVFDYAGKVIRKHGSMEHCRRLLGTATKRLAKGELVWMTDRTPHESLPLPASSTRQFFRLVVGEVTGWFVQHSTPNPLGYETSNSCDTLVNKIEGDKFTLAAQLPVYWEPGTVDTLAEGAAFPTLHRILNIFELGHVVEVLKRRCITSLQQLVTFWEEEDDVISLWSEKEALNEYGIDYMEYVEIDRNGDIHMMEYMMSQLQEEDVCTALHIIPPRFSLPTR